MSLCRLTYFSRNAIVPRGRPLDDEVAPILAASVANNQRFQITGGLIYDKHWFVQALEGPRTPVLATFNRIASDPRHGDVTVVDISDVEARRFGYWWMAGGEIGDLSADAAAPFDPRGMGTAALLDLIARVLDARMRAPIQTRSFEEVAARC